MRRMLDPKEVGGGLPSTITFDQEGNRTSSKDVKVDGKLKLKSLVSASNPDGDITKELGGGGSTATLYSHFIEIQDKNASKGIFAFNFITSRDTPITNVNDLNTTITNKRFICSGKMVQDGEVYFAYCIVGDATSTAIGYNTGTGAILSVSITNGSYNIIDRVSPVN